MSAIKPMPSRGGQREVMLTPNQQQLGPRQDFLYTDEFASEDNFTYSRRGDVEEEDDSDSEDYDDEEEMDDDSRSNFSNPL